MKLRYFWSLYSMFVLGSQISNAQIVTVTTHISACSATYLSRSTTVVASTVTVAPTPWNDALPNGGTPFVIRLEQVDTSGYPDQSPAPYWLMYNGNTTTNVSVAGVYRITNGQLMTYNGSYISTGFGVVDQAFAIYPGLGPISTYFFVNSSILNWTNSQFTNGTAQFYKLPPGLLQNAQILAKFVGPMERQRSWSPVVLYVDPVPTSIVLPDMGSAISSLSTGTSSPDVTHRSSSSSIDWTSSSGSLSAFSVSTSGPVSAMSISISIVTMPSSSSSANTTYTGSFVSPTALSRAGRCGGTTGETCTGSGFGNCCSRYGWCGSTSEYCSTGCQVSFGNCNVDQYSVSSASSSVTAATSGVSVSSSLVNTTIGSLNPSLSASSPSPSSLSSVAVTQASTFRGSTITPMSMTFSSMPSSSNGIPSTSTPPDARSSSAFPTSSLVSFSATTSSALTLSSTSPSSSSSSATSDSVSSIVSSSASEFSSSSSSSLSSPASSSSLALSYTLSSSVGSSSTRTSSGTLTSSSYSLSSSLSVSGGPGSVNTQSTSSPISSGSSTTGTFSSSTMSASSSSRSNSQSSSSTTSFPPSSSTTSFLPSSSTISSLSSSSSFPSSSPPSSSTLSSSKTATSSASTSSTSGPGCNAFTCPAIDGQSVTDCDGAIYTLGCNQDTTGGSDSGHQSSGGFNGCFNICDSTPGCQGFTFASGTTGGAGSGFCYLKSGYPEKLTFTSNSGGSYLVGAIRSAAVPVTSSSSYTSTISSTYVSTTSSIGMVSANTGSSTPSTSLGSISTTSSNSGSRSGTATGSSIISSYSSTYTCASTNYNFTTDAQGNTYKVYTDVDADGVSVQTLRTEVGTSDCMARCDITPGCTGWTYRGFDSTQTVGYCYLRTTIGLCRPGVTGVELGILVGGTPAPYPTTSSTRSSSASPSPSVTGNSFSSYVPPVRTSSSSSSSYVNPAVASNTANFIPSPTLCDFGDPPSYDQDDNYCEIDLPFPMQMYGYSDTHTFASTNGFVSLTNGSSAFDGGSLPSIFLPTYAVCPWFDDLEVYRSRNQNQGIYYSTPNGNSVYYEWILSRPATQDFYHFTVFYEQAVPGVFTYRYYATGGDPSSAGADGGTASVGAQGLVGGTEVAVQFSYDQKVLKAGLQIRCDTTAGSGTCKVIN